MSVNIEAQDLKQMDIKYREKEETTYGYVAIYLKERIGSINAFHFTFSMPSQQFKEQVPQLEAAAKKGSFQLNLIKKSRISLALEKLLTRALVGTEYRNSSCPACRMIEVAFIGHQSTA